MVHSRVDATRASCAEMFHILRQRLAGIGTKKELAAKLAAITGIEASYLEHKSIWSACVAQKMFWASSRETSRPEDIAYCLLGLFEVNMPLLYGEGAQKAFIRLQKEILSTSTDETIFAWTGVRLANVLGVLAPSPCYFAFSGQVVRGLGSTKLPILRGPWSLTNKGLFFQLMPESWEITHVRPGSEERVVFLDCAINGSDLPVFLSLINFNGTTWWRTSNKYTAHSGELTSESITRESITSSKRPLSTINLSL